DTLRYIGKDFIYRSYHQNDLTFGMVYAFSERFLLPFSHDEVVHGKASLLSKMPGDDWQKWAGMRLLYSYQICQPGKKLVFMGAEIGEWEEWNAKRSLQWDLLKYERHAQLHHLFKTINHFYLENRALWEYDFESCGFAWVDCKDVENCVLSYLRKSQNRYLLCVHHFNTPFQGDYFLCLEGVKAIQEVMNTDRIEFGGSGKTNEVVEIVKDATGAPIGIQIALSPLATMIFDVHF
ncbi:MAG: alpha amylase C-terminal domain-containing protein, partial [Chlamydiales bacterium]|nr:alpha amylase C-terminal domain-containing protein [Chlamydiales bacterium]